MRFRKKPVEIDAEQFDGNRAVADRIAAWIGPSAHVVKILTGAGVYYTIDIKTLEGVMTAMPQDWIIRGVQGEFYPCKPEIFELTYEPV